MTLSEEITQCQKCSLCRIIPESLTPVPPLLPKKSAKVMLVVDNPRSEELVIGEPISIYEQIFLKKYFDIDTLYITSLVKCNPATITPENKVKDRVAKKSEIKICSEWLIREIDELKPKTIVGCGKNVVDFFFKLPETLADIAFKPYIIKENLTFIPSYSLKSLLQGSNKNIKLFVESIRKSI